MVAEPWLQTHDQQEPDPHPEVAPRPECTTVTNVNESVAYFEERAVASALKSPVS